MVITYLQEDYETTPKARVTLTLKPEPAIYSILLLVRKMQIYCLFE